MISLMIAFQYIVSFLVPGVVNLPVTSGTNANPPVSNRPSYPALYGPVENLRYQHRYWRRGPCLKRCDLFLPFSAKKIRGNSFGAGRKRSLAIWHVNIHPILFLLPKGLPARITTFPGGSRAAVFAGSLHPGFFLSQRVRFALIFSHRGVFPGPIILPLWGRGSNGFIFCFCGLYQHLLRKNTPIY